MPGFENIKKTVNLSIYSLLRAIDGVRTRDPDLGKVVLYQLSYFRRGLVYYGCKDSVFRGLHQIFLLFFIGC